MKILVANIGSTSLKWRLFDFSNNAERLLHKGGFERVTDYPKAIEDCLAQLKDVKAIASESELAAVGFKTVIAKNVRLEESPAYKESIFSFAPDSRGALDYYRLSEEVIGRV